MILPGASAPGSVVKEIFIMNRIYGMSFVYESLVPVENPDVLYFSVGTITMDCCGKEICLDFKETSASWHEKNGKIVFSVEANDFNPNTFEEEYQAIGLKASDLVYGYFSSNHRFMNTLVTEVYIECVQDAEEVFIPLKLKGVQLHFLDGRFLNYGDKINVEKLD